MQPEMESAKFNATDDDLYWLTLTAYHEARGESEEGQRAVAKIILDIAKNKEQSIQEVVLAPRQFSAFNAGLSSKIVRVSNNPVFVKIRKNMEVAINEWNQGKTLKGATHYYAIKGMKNQKPPYWAPSMEFITEIGGHRFLKEN